jgi:predicted DNA-binding transcriptional regulator YafY
VKRLERLTSLLSFLQSKRFIGIQDIETRFQVSERTIYRDIRSLQEAGVPISYEKNKGYFILDRYYLPPLAFTIEEAKSFIFVEQVAKKYIDDEIFKEFSSALEKIKNKLRTYQLDGIETIEPNVKAYINPNFTPRFLKLIEEACSHKKVMQIKYKDIMGNPSEREVEPIGITFYSQVWHLIAYCRLRNDYRDFSLSRIIEISETNETMTEKRLNLSEYIQKIDKNKRD